MSRTRRVFGYARVSSKEQALGTSLQDQQNAITAYAASRGLTVTKFYVEAASAVHEKVERREQMLQLRRDVRKGDLVLCDKLDRWSRDAAYSHTSIKEILAMGASFYAVGDQCDPSTDEGDTMLGFRILFAREEHKRIKVRMVGTRKLIRDAGYYVEGLPPYGYVRPFGKGHKGIEKNILSIDADGAALVRRAFKLCIEGRSLSLIATELGLVRDRVHDMLRSRVYLGQIENSKGIWIKGKHEPIIDVDMFTRAQAAIASRKNIGRSPGGKSETSTWMLRDIARCGLCGAKMTAAYAGPQAARRYYYRCFAKCTSHYVPVRVIEAEAAALVPGRLDELREMFAQVLIERAPIVVDYASQRAKIARSRERYVEMYAEDQITRESLNKKLATLDADLLRIVDAEDAVARPSALSDTTARREMLRTITGIAKAWKATGSEDRRIVVNHLATAVRLAPGAAPKFVWRSAEDLAEDVRT